MAKENRQNLRLWADGVRETILTEHIATYADALERDWRAERDTLQNICNEFHARISWRLADHEEPDLPLPDYDPTKIVEPEELSDEEEGNRGLESPSLTNEFVAGSSIVDPWTVLLAKLSGIKSPPKARQAYQQFMHEAFTEQIAPVVAERWAAEVSNGSSVQTKKDPDGPFRAKIAREVFAALSDADREMYATRAKEEAAEARKEYDKAMKDAPSRSPQAKQSCIDNVGAFLAPILQGIHERTGMHSTVILGGPVPKFGELRTIFVSYGRNKTANPSHFPAWAQDRFTAFLEVVKEYLGTAFTTQDIEDSRLPDALAGAKYTMPSSSDSEDPFADTESEAESTETDSNADSDDSNSPKVKKRAKMQKRAEKKKGEKAAAKGKAGKAQKKVEGKAAEKEKERKRNAETKKVARKKKKDTDSDTDTESDSDAEPDTNKKKKKHKDAGDSDDDSDYTGKKKSPRTKNKNAIETDSDAGAKAKRKKNKTATTSDTTATKKRPRDKSPITARKSRRLNADAVPMDVDPAPALPTSSTQQDLPPPPSTQPDLPPPSSTQPDLPLPSSAQPIPTSPPEVAPTLPLVFPDNAPAWLTNSLAWLMKEDLGCHYRALVVALIELETKYGFDAANNGALLTTNRPSQLSSWIRGGRGTRMKFPPAINNTETYAKQWAAWWGAMQPAWRERGEDGHWKVGGAWGAANAWDPLEAPGPNGCLSLVASLYFWGLYKSQPPHVLLLWERAVQDVTWMLEGLAVSIT
ncbi:hypothetical protein B0H13DRAFT_1870706 [Mycena leptocephala]|nr:hypothetical protein B0H13DRAFT_1870706 [Mycena leptocephala]